MGLSGGENIRHVQRAQNGWSKWPTFGQQAHKGWGVPDHGMWSKILSCSNDNDDDGHSQAAVCCQSAWPPRFSVLTANFHAFAEYSTAHFSAKQQYLLPQYSVKQYNIFFSRAKQQYARPTSTQPISDSPVCRARGSLEKHQQRISTVSEHKILPKN